MTTASQNKAFMERGLMTLMTALADQKERAAEIELTIIALAVAAGLPGVLPAPAG
jgi:hypothetical protein